jgi:glycosyltransferase involved in cell wall biosynthesis
LPPDLTDIIYHIESTVISERTVSAGGNCLLISVIIPTYNRKTFLSEAIRSVQAQTYRDWELIVVDDGSSDDTPTAIRREGIRCLRTDHSGRPGRVRNIGAQAASGNLLAFLDSDDLWKPEKLSRQAAFFREHPEVSLCHTREIWLRNGRIISQAGQRHRRSGDIFEDALEKCIIGPSTVVLTKELFQKHGGFHPELEIAEDYELWLRICNTEEVGYIDEALVVKRAGHSDQLSERYGRIEYFRLLALGERIESGSFKGENRELALKEMSRKCRIYAAGCRKRHKEEEARRYFAMAEEYEDRLEKEP